MKSTSEFDQLCVNILREDMTAGAVVGSSAGLQGGSVGNTDSYAPGDMRLPFSQGIQRRLKKKKKKHGKSRSLAKSS